MILKRYKNKYETITTKQRKQVLSNHAKITNLIFSFIYKNQTSNFYKFITAFFVFYQTKLTIDFYGKILREIKRF